MSGTRTESSSSLTGKNIVVGISGGIAAYKAADLVSKLKKSGAEINVIMTEAAKQFIGPAALTALSGKPVLDNLFAQTGRVTHIEVATGADAFVIAPATANIIGKMAHGIADDFLSTGVLAARCPIIVAPAMNDKMYLHPAVQENMRILSERGVDFVQPESGALACGTEGVGRLAAVEDILLAVHNGLNKGCDLAGKKVLVTAGGTREAIDPVRYIGNHSSGKMGYALAAAAAARGAAVVLIAANTNLAPPAGVRLLPVTSAQEMSRAVLAEYPQVDVVIKAAAVADYRPALQAGKKIKKQQQQLTITLEPTEDILARLGQEKQGQILVGFAAETDDLLEHAAAKVKKKNLDMIVANDVSRSDIGFAADENQVTLIFADGSREELPKMSKDRVAQQILDRIVSIINNQNTPGKEE